MKIIRLPPVRIANRIMVRIEGVWTWIELR